MEVPQSPEVTALNSTAVLTAELSRARQELRVVADVCKAIAVNPVGMPTANVRLRGLVAHIEDFLKK